MDESVKNTKKSSNLKKRSLSLQIGFLYIILAIGNITFFSAMILENQTELLLINFKYRSKELADTVLGELKNVEISPSKDENYQLLKKSLSNFHLISFSIFTSEGILWHQYPETKNQPNKISKKIQEKSEELDIRDSLFRSRYLLELNEKDFSLDFMLPVTSGVSKQRIFLLARMDIQSIKERLVSIYYQIGGAIAWGVIFHLLFAIFIFRVILKRIQILNQASIQMKDGDLSIRAEWKRKRDKVPDELDILGDSFNSMASEIQGKVETISKLNSQIQQELVIGKEVQNLFLSSDVSMEVLKPAVFCRPLREVSGDVYSYFSFKGNLQGVFFADASGHGVSAALITVITLMSLEDIISQKIKFGQVIPRLNKLLAQRFDYSYYASGIFALFTPDHKLHIVNAGHTTALLLPSPERGDSAKTMHISSQGPPIGLAEESTYPVERIDVFKGDKIFIYSDGLIETTDDNQEQFGFDRILSCLEANAQKEPIQIQKALEENFSQFAKNYADDVTFMILEVP